MCGNGGNYFHCNDAPLVWLLLYCAKYYNLAVFCWYKKTDLFSLSPYNLVKITINDNTQFKKKREENVFKMYKLTQYNVPAVVVLAE